MNNLGTNRERGSLLIYRGTGFLRCTSDEEYGREDVAKFPTTAKRGSGSRKRSVTRDQQLIFKSFQSPGDIVMMSAAVRDLHKAHPGQFVTDVRTSAPAIWENNPYLTPLREGDDGVTVLQMHYPAIHQSNQRPYHFIHGYVQFLEQQFDLRIPVTSSLVTSTFPGGEGTPAAWSRAGSPGAILDPGSRRQVSTSRPSGGTRTATRRLSITSVIALRSSAAASKGTGTRG